MVMVTPAQVQYNYNTIQHNCTTYNTTAYKNFFLVLQLYCAYADRFMATYVWFMQP